MWESKISNVFCLLLSVFFIVGDKIAADHIKDEIIPSLKVNFRLKFSQYMVMNHVREKEKPQ